MEHNISVPNDEDVEVFDNGLQRTKVLQMEEWSQ
jgi:hypothetical protein